MESSNVQVTDLPPNTAPSSYGLYASSARANTFINHPSGQTWSDECPSSETMGKFGFHFTPSGRYKDRVTCFYCQVSQTGWKGITDPSEHHLKKNRSCYFAKIYNFLNRRASGEVLDWRKMNGFNEPFCEEAMQARLSTFHDLWPHDHREGFKSTSRTLTESGFSFVPQSDHDDLVICIYCGITLEGWELTDDPIQEHKRRDEGGQCYFLKRYEELKASGADMPTLDNPLTVSTVAKSRGRPKSKLTSETTSQEINQTQDDQFKSSPSKKRGRPKKAANSEIPSSPTKRRGRTPKTASSPSKDTDDYEPPIRARRSPLRKPNHEEAEDSAHTAFTDLTASSVSRTRPRRNVKSPKKYTEYESDEDIPVKPVASKPVITDEQIAPNNSEEEEGEEEEEEENIHQNNNSDESYGLTSHSIELASESKPYQPLLKRYGSKARTSKITKSSNASSSMVRNNNRSQTLSMSPIKKSKLLDSSFDNEGMFSTNNLRGVEIGAGLTRMGSILKDLNTESRSGSGDGVNDNVTSVTLKEKTQEELAKEVEEEGVEQEEEGEVTLIANDITESPLKSSKGITAVSDENESSQEGALGSTNETPKPTEVIPGLELDVQDDQQEEQEEEEEEEAEEEEEEIPIEVEQEAIETETEPQAEERDEDVNEEPELPPTEQELLNDDGSSEDERDQEEQQEEQEEEHEEEQEQEREQKYIEITSGNSDYQDSVMYQPQMEEMRVEEVSEAQGHYDELVVGGKEAQESQEQQTASPEKNDDQIDEDSDSNDTVIRYKVGNMIDKVPTQPVSIEGPSVIEIKPHRMPMSSTPVKQPLADITDKERSKHSNTEARDEEEDEEEIENTTNNNTGLRQYLHHPRVSNKENQFNSRKRNINDDFDGNSSPESSLIQSSPTLNKVKRSKILNSKISHGSIHETFNNSSLPTQVLDPMKSSLKGYRQHSRTNSNSNSNLNLSALNNKSVVSISSSSSATLVNLLDNGATRLAQRSQSRFVNNNNIPATGKKEKSTLKQSHTIASQPINSHNSSKFNSELPVIADDLPIGESTENNIIVTTTTATTASKQPQKSLNEPVKWHPTNIDTIFENLQDLELAKNYLMTLSELGYDLDEDIDGRITNFINQMPTEELEMTLEQWIEHIAEEGALHFNEIANLMIENFQMESDRALAVLEALPTVD